MRKGALPDRMIHNMIEGSFIKGANPKNVSPASLDLSMSEEVYRVNGMFLPRFGESIRDLLSRLDRREHQVGMPFERDVVYLARLNESLKLPGKVYGYCNPKSSTGRNDVHVRILADGVPRYDAVTPAGFKGSLWAVIVARSYPVIVPVGQPLSQLRLFNADTRIGEEELEIAFKRDRILRTLGGDAISYEQVLVREGDGSLILTLDLESEIPAYEYSGRHHILDLGKGNSSHAGSDFFTPVHPVGGHLFLRRGSFYILSTLEAVVVPPYFACEMVPMDERFGEFRSHYAGFIDPGWGYGSDGEGKGRPLTLEVRPFEDMVISGGQPIAKIKFERMAEIPEVHYDQKDSNYLSQSGPKLAKHFI